MPTRFVSESEISFKRFSRLIRERVDIGNGIFDFRNDDVTILLNNIIVVYCYDNINKLISNLYMYPVVLRVKLYWIFDDEIIVTLELLFKILYVIQN